MSKPFIKLIRFFWHLCHKKAGVKLILGVLLSLFLLPLLYGYTSSVENFNGRSNPFNISFDQNLNQSFLLNITMDAYIKSINFTLIGNPIFNKTNVSIPSSCLNYLGNRLQLAFGSNFVGSNTIWMCLNASGWQEVTGRDSGTKGYEEGIWWNVSGVNCFQETANGSNIHDGTCGLNYTGNYYSSDVGWDALNQFYDGDYSTPAFGTGGTNYLYFNYSIPPNTTSAIWQIERGVNALKYVSNINITLNGINQFNYSGELKTLVTSHINLTLANNFLSLSQPLNLTFHSDTIGSLLINLTNVTISYGIDNCSNSFGISSNATTLNISFKNFTTGNPISVNYQYFLNYGENLTATANGINNISFCIYPNWANLSTSLQSTYTNNGNSYTYDDSLQLFNQTTYLTLYTEDGFSQVLLTVYDYSNNPQSNITIKVLKQTSPNVFTTYEILTTDNNGRALANLVLNTVFYRFILEQDGETIATEQSSLIIPSLSSSCAYASCKNFYVLIGSSTWFDKKIITNGVATSLYYNNDTHNFVYNWNDPSNSMHQACLRVDIFNSTRSMTLTDTCTESMAGTILYNVDVNNNNKYVATGYLKFDQKIITNILEIYNAIATKFAIGNTLTVFLAFILSLTLLFLGLRYGAIVANILFTLGIAASFLLGFWIVSLTSLVTMIIFNVINYLVVEY